MKVKKFSLLLCTLCLFCMLPIVPAAAKSKPAPKKLILSRNEIVLYAGESTGLCVVNTKPADASVKVTWKSQNKKVAAVSPKGEVTAKKPGKTVITATLKKNPAVRAAVRLKVKKAPAKVEKEYKVTCGHWYSVSDCPAGYEYACPPGSISGKALVIRSAEGFQKLQKVWNRKNALPFRKTRLGNYKNMDFSRYSLVILSHPFGYVSIFSEAAFSAKLDSSGKLQGRIEIDYENTGQDGGIRPAVMDAYTIALQIKKSDEAMVDYYSVWGKPYSKFIIAP